ncbi:terminase large subunit domain-containing protein [Nesterenkonia sp. Act20]|uniref:terminase large subunit domain-containing protein n=1 Tax=Nesterenkonia sp. Act20 TaxID=1483432 RepID=UPI001C4583F3|nr:terminase large subunit [Nesterenkonia sp. Act20]
MVPKGHGAGSPLRLRDWQLDLVGSVLDADPMPVQAGFMMPRGSGKSALMSAWGLYDLLLGDVGASVVVVAVNETQAKIIFNVAVRMVELNEDLSSRVQVYKDRLEVPSRGSSFQVLPASPKALEGLDFTLALADEIGVISQDVWEVVALAQGKRERSTMVGIGTPGPDPHNSVLTNLRDYHRKYPDDPTLVWREFSAAGFEHHPVDCDHCLKLANPALGDFLNISTIKALLPPKTREATYRRARLCQFVTETTGAFLPEGRWEEMNTGEEIAEGEDVVLALDGSFNGDATGVLVARIGMEPHFDVVGLWEPPGDDDSYRVPVEEVEDAIRAACKRWNVLEVTADPFRWTRTLQVLEKEGIPITEFPWSAARITPATTDFYNACINGQITHTGDPRLAEHIGNAVVNETERGVRLDKSRKHTTRHIDLAACAVMGHSRAQWRAMTKKKKRRARSFK